MKCIVERRLVGEIHPREFLAPSGKWASRLGDARVFTNAGHAKNAISCLRDQPAARYYVNPVKVVLDGAAEAFPQ